MKTAPKTAKTTVALYPADHARFPGLRQPIVRAPGGGWEWRPGATSSHKAAAIDHAEAAGARVIVEIADAHEVRCHDVGPKALRDLLRF